MNPTEITAATDLNSLSLPLDQRAEIVPGCLVYQWQHTASVKATLTVWPAEGRGAFALNGDSSWGDWDGEKLALDDGGHVAPGAAECCPYGGCTRAAHEHDADGDLACEEHAAKSYDWVIVTDLSEGSTWLEADMAERVEAILAEQGWSVEIREPRSHNEAQATYYRKSNGDLQIVGYSIPKPEALRRALDEAYAVI